MKIKTIAIFVLVFTISCVTAQTPSKADKIERKPKENSEQARIPGEIGSGADAIVAPATVTVNQDFEVTVRTSGNGCVSQGDTGVVLGETSADIFVYDLTTATRAGTMCTMIFKQFEHKATLRFEKKGAAVIRVWARQTDGKSPSGNPVVVERRVLVR